MNPPQKFYPFALVAGAGVVVVVVVALTVKKFYKYCSIIYFNMYHSRVVNKVQLVCSSFQMVILSDPGGGKGGDHLRKKRNNDRQVSV